MVTENATAAGAAGSVVVSVAAVGATEPPASAALEVTAADVLDTGADEEAAAPPLLEQPATGKRQRSSGSDSECPQGRRDGSG